MGRTVHTSGMLFQFARMNSSSASRLYRPGPVRKVRQSTREMAQAADPIVSGRKTGTMRCRPPVAAALEFADAIFAVAASSCARLVSTFSSRHSLRVGLTFVAAVLRRPRASGAGLRRGGQGARRSRAGWTSGGRGASCCTLLGARCWRGAASARHPLRVRRTELRMTVDWQA